MNAPDLKRKAGGLLSKWALLGLALSSKQLSAADCAVLHYLCDRYDEDRGYAWPSLATIARDTGRDLRTAGRAVEQLVRLEWVHIVKQGDRVSSNQYRPAFERGEVRAEPPVAAGSPLGAELPEGKGETARNVRAKRPLKPTYDPGYEAGGSGGGPGAGAPGAGSGVAADAAPAPAGTTRRYPEFWAVYPKASSVFAAENLLDDLQRQGVLLQDIVAGAAAYARWVALQPWSDKNRYTAGAAKWLEQRRWLDDFSAPRAASTRTTRGTARSTRRHTARATGFETKDFLK